MDQELQEIYERLLARGYQRELFGDLPRFHRDGKNYTALCPFHDDRKPSLSISGDKPLWNCFGCGEAGDWVKYLEKQKGLPFQEAKELLAKEAGVEITTAHRGKWKRQAEQAELLEDALGFFREQLWTVAGKRALAYLRGRGYTEAEIKNMGLGYYPGAQKTRDYLVKAANKDYTVNTVNSLLVHLDKRKEYTVVLPYRDPWGRLNSLWGRLTRELKPGENDSYKYLPFTGTERPKETPFNLDKAKGGDTLVVVEGYFDALIATERGIPGVVALGGAVLREVHLEAMIKHGARNIVLALDNDPSGQSGTEKALGLIQTREQTEQETINCYVATLPEGCKDPDDLIREQGVEAFKQAIDEAQSAQDGFKWKAKRILQKHDLQTDRGKSDAWDEGLAFATGLRPKRVKPVIDLLSEALGYPLELIEAEVKSSQERQARKRFDQDLRRVLAEADKRPPREVEEQVRKLRLQYERGRIKPTVPLSDYLRAKYEQERQREPGTETLLGYGLNRLTEIARKIDGIQAGLYIVGSHTNIGKTAFLTNLFLDLLETNPHAKGLYFSLDDNKDVIINRLISISTGLDLNTIQKGQDRPEDQEKIEKAYRDLAWWAETGRLTIKDVSEVGHIDDLEIEVREQAGDALSIFMDGLQNLAVGKEYGTIREENIARADRVKALADFYKIPVVCSTELRKRPPGQGQDKPPTIDDFMETGKFAYNSNLAWLLFPDNTERFKTEDEPILRLEFAKNKLSYYRGTIGLKFIRAKGQLEVTNL